MTMPDTTDPAALAARLRHWVAMSEPVTRDLLRAAADALDGLGREVVGLEKAMALLNAGFESTAEDRDRLKHRVRELVADNARLAARLAAMRAALEAFREEYLERGGGPPNLGRVAALVHAALRDG